jgi:hypothetical protein
MSSKIDARFEALSNRAFLTVRPAVSVIFDEIRHIGKVEER